MAAFHRSHLPFHDSIPLPTRMALHALLVRYPSPMATADCLMTEFLIDPSSTWTREKANRAESQVGKAVCSGGQSSAWESAVLGPVMALSLPG